MKPDTWHKTDEYINTLLCICQSDLFRLHGEQTCDGPTAGFMFPGFSFPFLSEILFYIFNDGCELCDVPTDPGTVDYGDGCRDRTEQSCTL